MSEHAFSCAFNGLRVWWLVAVVAVAQTSGAGEPFEFVVIGDTRPRFESHDFRVFEGLVRKINEAKPALVINLGDLIYGYGMGKEKQWEKYEQVARGCKAPYYQVPGNHDTFSKEARRVYERRFGKFYESFNHGGCHFVLLDTCEETHWGSMGPRELEWLKTDLRTNAVRPVFVFMHFPLWEPERIKPQYHDFWTQTLHPLFRESGVKAVFGGHYHTYGPTREFDGIRYFITGGGGAELRPDYRKSGGEHHFVKVKVSGEEIDVRVVTSRGELTDPEADVMGGFLFADRYVSRIGVARGTGNLREGIAGRIALDNPYPEWLVGKASWQADSTSFSVEPGTFEIRVPPGGTERLAFKLKALAPTASVHSFPSLEFQVTAGGRHRRFHRELVLTETLEAPLVPEVLTLDGALTEWKRAPRLKMGSSVSGETEVRAFHDRTSLYLAVTVPRRSPALVAQEQEAFPDDLLVGIAGRVNESEFGRDLIRLGFTRDGAGAQVRDRTPGQRPERAVPGARAASRGTADGVTFEVAIPKKLVAPLRPAGRTHLVLSLSVPVSREQGAAGEPQTPAPNSFAYQVRYGGDALIPVNFVELVLKGKP